MSKVCQIVAVDKNNCIGRGNEMAWHIPSDFKYFKETTKGHPIIMGRKTFESIGRPLPGRLSIVLTRNLDLDLPEGVVVTDSIDKAIACAKEATDYDTSKVFIIGGAQIYKASLEQTDEFFITRVATEIENGDAYYPELPEGLKLSSSKESFDKYDLKFEVYSR
ncbi:MAG: dihydrofolate reductase [Bdellovibrionales bacterium]